MKRLLFIVLMLSVLLSCKTTKQVVKDSTLEQHSLKTDSLAVSEKFSVKTEELSDTSVILSEETVTTLYTTVKGKDSIPYSVPLKQEVKKKTLEKKAIKSRDVDQQKAALSTTKQTEDNAQKQSCSSSSIKQPITEPVSSKWWLWPVIVGSVAAVVYIFRSKIWKFILLIFSKLCLIRLK
jgi:hypothetical protein